MAWAQDRLFLGVTIAVAIALLELFRWAFHLAGSDFFEFFPLFPFTFPAAVLVQLCAKRYNFEWAVNRRAVEGLGGIAIDGVVICASGGFVTALAVPLIALCGLPAFTIATAVMTVALTVWGIKRAGHWT